MDDEKEENNNKKRGGITDHQSEGMMQSDVSCPIVLALCGNLPTWRKKQTERLPVGQHMRVVAELGGNTH
jgi:hypothetical protein